MLSIVIIIILSVITVGVIHAEHRNYYDDVVYLTKNTIIMSVVVISVTYDECLNGTMHISVAQKELI
jgi:hypothetical protein